MNEALLWVGLSVLVANLTWMSAVARRVLGFRRQGSRLKSLTGQSLTSVRRGAVVIVAALVSVVVTYGFLAALDVGFQEPGAGWAVVPWLNLGLRLNCSVLIAAVCVFFCRLRLTGRFGQRAKTKLDELPKVKNGVVLGTAVENMDSDREENKWVILNQRALNGNVFITGSIGSGKTQGTILPVFEQILTNFEPRPSILAIDPKGTFVAEALKIIKDKKLSDHCQHLFLGGQVKFNPIYHPKALKGSHYLDIAQMVRAAAVNFMGRSFDSPFWEISSFNLIKNSLIYCAAVHRYYTLNDLYDAMIRALEPGFCDRLRNVGDSEAFDEEEKFNIGRAWSYFSAEFSSLDDKVRTGILATSTAFLQQFQEYQASRIFCPRESELTFRTMDEVVDNGKLLMFDINSPALAKSMGTFIKLHYQQSLLNRLTDLARGKSRSGVLLIDEYQDVCSTGYGAAIGDDRFLAKGREANAITIVASQSISSIENSIGKEKSAKELVQNFRTRLAGHSLDVSTIKLFQELAGDADKEKVSHSISELSQDAKKNYFFGGFDSKNANISESISKSQHKEFIVSGKAFSRLGSFECFAQIYDGFMTRFVKLFLKPYFLKDKRTPHIELLKRLTAASVLMLAIGFVGNNRGYSYPTVCSAVNTPDLSSCVELQVAGCTCGIPPRPCSQLSYYVPETFVEVMPHGSESHFTTLAGASLQLSSLPTTRTPYGVEGDDDTQAFHAHTLPVPHAGLAFKALACGDGPSEATCFASMSEHLGDLWLTGSADLLQPNFLAWELNPKACLLKGAATSLTGEVNGIHIPGSPACSTPRSWLRKFPPSAHSACTGWGVFYPRYGTYSGPSQNIGALMIASRMRSLASEVFKTSPTYPDEKWQMIYPGGSGCFREGQNAGLLETALRVNDAGRVTSGRLKGYLFVIWRRVTCCQELSSGPQSTLALSGIKAACTGVR